MNFTVEFITMIITKKQIGLKSEVINNNSYSNLKAS